MAIMDAPNEEERNYNLLKIQNPIIEVHFIKPQDLVNATQEWTYNQKGKI